MLKLPVSAQPEEAVQSAVEEFELQVCCNLHAYACNAGQDVAGYEAVARRGGLDWHHPGGGWQQRYVSTACIAGARQILYVPQR